MTVPDDIKKIQGEVDLWGPLDESLIEHKVQINREAGKEPEELLGLLYTELRKLQWGRLKQDRRIQQLTEQISYIERKVIEADK